MDDTPDPTRQEPDTQAADLRRRTGAAVVLLGLALAALLIAATTVGFGPYDGEAHTARPPTLWDWLQLLVVPAVLALGALWFNKSQKDTELRIADKARAADREIAGQARKADSDIAEARQRQATLEAYFDRMTELLLEHDLRKSAKDSDVRSIARARTVAVLRSLDGDRNRQLLAFLRTSKLLERYQPIIALAGTDLSGADLRRTDLSNVDLSGTNLNGANLSMADLKSADLREARLWKATLHGTNLQEANLREAAPLEAILFEAILSGTDFRRADLRGADLRFVFLTKANLQQANLSEADLSWAYLNEADLSGSNLREANLREARGMTFQQLDQAKDVAGATMPDGIQLGGVTLFGERIEGPTFEEWKAQYLARQAAENPPPPPAGEITRPVDEPSSDDI